MVFTSRDRGVINIILSTLIAVFIYLLPKSQLWWIGVGICGITEILLVYGVQSREEKYFNKEVEHNQKKKERKWKFDDDKEKIAYKNKLKKLQGKAEKVEEGKFTGFIKLEEFNKDEKIAGDKKDD